MDIFERSLHFIGGLLYIFIPAYTFVLHKSIEEYYIKNT